MDIKELTVFAKNELVNALSSTIGNWCSCEIGEITPVVSLEDTDGEQSQVCIQIKVSPKTCGEEHIHNFLVGWDENQGECGFVYGEDGEHVLPITNQAVLMWLYFDKILPES